MRLPHCRPNPGPCSTRLHVTQPHPEANLAHGNNARGQTVGNSRWSPKDSPVCHINGAENLMQPVERWRRRRRSCNLMLLTSSNEMPFWIASLRYKLCSVTTKWDISAVPTWLKWTCKHLKRGRWIWKFNVSFSSYIKFWYSLNSTALLFHYFLEPKCKLCFLDTYLIFLTRWSDTHHKCQASQDSIFSIKHTHTLWYSDKSAETSENWQENLGSLSCEIGVIMSNEDFLCLRNN